MCVPSSVKAGCVVVYYYYYAFNFLSQHLLLVTVYIQVIFVEVLFTTLLGDFFFFEFDFPFFDLSHRWIQFLAEKYNKKRKFSFHTVLFVNICVNITRLKIHCCGVLKVVGHDLVSTVAFEDTEAFRILFNCDVIY